MLHLWRPRGRQDYARSRAAAGAGIPGRAKSPTYALVEPYSFSRLDLYHFDFYRFKDSSEWLNSGFREHFNPRSLCVVEWPEKAAELVAAPDLHISLQFEGEARRARLEARSGWRSLALVLALFLAPQKRR